MATVSEPTLDQALALARQLSPQQRATLITRLVQEFVTPPLPTSPPAGDVWAAWAALREQIGHAYPQANLAARLEADRRERDGALGRLPEDGNVHT